MSTLLELRTAVRAVLDEVSARFWPDSQLNIWINGGCRDIARKAEVIQQFNTSISAVAGTAKYPLPTDVIRVHRVEFVPTGQNQIYTLMASTDQEMDQVWGINQNQQGIYPQYFTIWGYPGGAGAAALTLKLYPVPSQPGTLNVYYYSVPTTLVADTDVATIPTGWQDIVAMYCEYNARRKDRDPTWQDVKKMYDDKIEELVESSRQWHDQAGSVSVGMSNVPSWLYSFDW